MNDVTWYVFGLILTVVGLFLSYRAYQKSGVAAGTRGVAWSLLPLAAALTGTLELAGELTEEVGRFLVNLVFDPFVWIGVALGGTSLALFVASRWMGGRAAKRPERGSPELPLTPSRKPAAPVDDELADIEAILRKHGIQ